MRAKLTKRAVEAVKPSAGDVFLWDTALRGYGVKITPTGRRVFVVQYDAPNLHRVSRRYTVGQFGPLTVDAARDEATKILARVIKGEDPARDKVAGRRAAKEETVERIFAEYLAYGAEHFTARTLAFYESLSKLHVLPALGKLPVAEVTQRHVAKLHYDLRDRRTTANRAVQLVRAFFYWLEKQERFTGRNPAKNVELYPETARETFLSVEQMAKLGQALRVAETIGLEPAPEHRPDLEKRKAVRAAAPDKAKAGGVKRERNAGMFKSELTPANPVAVAALRFLMFTGWRETEALTLKWEHLDLARGFATLPLTKTKKSVRVVATPALEILSEAAKWRVKDSPYVFPGRTPTEPLKEIQRLWYAARSEAGLQRVRLHDLRHSVASFAGGRGYSLFLIGKLLGHADQRSTARYAHLSDDIRKTMADDVGEVIREAMAAATATENEGTPVIALDSRR